MVELKNQTLEDVTDMFFQPKTETLDDIIRWRLQRYRWEALSETELLTMKNIILTRINCTIPPYGQLTEDGIFEFTVNYYAMTFEAFETLTHFIIASETTEQKIVELFHQVRGNTRVANETE